MKPALAFVHTAQIHVPTFERLLAEEAPAVKAKHVVVEALLCDAQSIGTRDLQLIRRIHEAMVDAAAEGASIVVCTCSTIGGVAERTPTDGRFLAMRIDRAMADLAVRSGPRILVVAALESTVAPTSDLLRESANALGCPIVLNTLLVAAAWRHFEQGNRDGYIDCLDRALRGAPRTYDVVVLAQASMGPLVDRLSDFGVPVLASPRLGVQAAVRALSGERSEDAAAGGRP